MRDVVSGTKKGGRGVTEKRSSIENRMTRLGDASGGKVKENVTKEIHFFS
jgi:hypothetical protein